jgi:metallo-beta-lactamase family protein
MLVPVFAVGRTQLLLYLLAQMFRNKTVPKFPVYLDTPMGIEATKIYWDNMELFDDEFKALQRERPISQDLSTLTVTPTAQDSMKLNDEKGPCLIMAGSGMCNGGRILHHLKQNLWREGTSVLIVGYQSEGSLGRRLVDREPVVSIFGEKIAVKASIHTLNGFSAHAGQTELLKWVGAGGEMPAPRVSDARGSAGARAVGGKDQGTLSIADGIARVGPERETGLSQGHVHHLSRIKNGWGPPPSCNDGRWICGWCRWRSSR